MDIRAVTAADDFAISALARAVFPPTQSGFVRPGPDGGLVARVDGSIVAAALVRVIRLPSGARVGMIGWLLTSPDYRGLGLASRLVEACVHDLQARGCECVVTDVEGYNTRSANVFLGNGFGRLSLGTQLRQFGLLATLWLWLRTGLAVDPGHFMWVRNAASGSPHQGLQRAGSWLTNVLLAGFALLLGGGLLLAGAPELPGPGDWLALATAVAVLFGAREAAMRATAAWLRQPLQYRAWEGGFGVTLVITLLFGRLLPMPGGLYPPGDGWKYQEVLPRLGPVAVAGTLTVAAIIATTLLVRDPDAGGTTQQLAFAMLFIGKPLLLFDSVVAIAPFTAFNARRIFDYNRLLWMVIAAIGVVLFLF